MKWPDSLERCVTRQVVITPVDPEKPAIQRGIFVHMLFENMKPGSKIEAKNLLPDAAAS